MYRVRVEAARNYDAQITEEESKISPWMKILCDPKIAKTFHFDEIDKIQCLAIHQKMEYDSTRRNWGPDYFYHCYIRPIERLFTIDMPLNNQLIAALSYRDATEDLGLFIKYLIGWTEYPECMDAQSIVEEFSKVQNVFSSQLRCLHQDDIPLQLIRKLECRDSKTARYVNKTYRPLRNEEVQSTYNNPFQHLSTEETDKRSPKQATTSEEPSKTWKE